MGKQVLESKVRGESSREPRTIASTPMASPSVPSRALATARGGSAILSALRVAAANLEAHVEEVDALNVFPVPDGDTGTNMLATVRSALGEADGVPPEERTLPRVATAISFGALMGARGNSGLILSQILRGMVEIGRERRMINGLDLAFGLRRGSETAYAAIAEPVEGTILTVIRETADAAVEAAEQDPSLESVLEAAVKAAQLSVARTPMLLPILHEAGVVDSGGQGLYRLLEGALAAMRGDTVANRSPSPAGVRAPLASHGDDDGWGYETMFVVSTGGAPLDLSAMRVKLESIGDSVLVAGDPSAAKVHVHNDRPDRVIAYGLSLGRLSRITVENLDDQALDVAEARARAFTGVPDRVDGRGTAERAAAVVATAKSATATAVRHDGLPEGGGPAAVTGPAVVVVAAGEGLARAMQSTGARGVVRGGQAANPSAGELVAAIRATGAVEILILPNHPSIRLAAEQAAMLVPDLVVEVVPTRTGPEGIAAMLAFDPRRSAAENAGPMLVAARAVRTLAVTRAVRDARCGGRRVRRGQTIVLDADDGLVAADPDRLRAALAGVASLAPGFELLTLYYGEDADLAEAESLAQRLAESIPGIEVEILHGGQPHYSYLIAAE